MAKSFGIHKLELLEGVTPEEFESFANTIYNPTATDENVPSKVQIRVVKGDKGERNEQYSLIIEFPTVEIRNAITGTPPSGPDTSKKENKEFFEYMKDLQDNFSKYAKGVGYTDYFEL